MLTSFKTHCKSFSVANGTFSHKNVIYDTKWMQNP